MFSKPLRIKEEKRRGREKETEKSRGIERHKERAKEGVGGRESEREREFKEYLMLL